MSSLQEHIARHERAEGGNGMSENEYIDIVFDGPPAPESGRFVEVENAAGASISLGEWVERPDGYWVLRISDQQQRIRELEGQIDGAHPRYVAEELAEQLPARDAVIAQVRGAADKAERGALRWADPLPVPEWVERVRAILDAAPESVLAEHDAQVLEEAAAEVDGYLARPVGANTIEQQYFRPWHAGWLRKRAAEYRNGATHE